MHIERYVTFLAANEVLLAFLNVAAVGGVLFALFRSFVWLYRFVREWWQSSFRNSWRLFKVRLAKRAVFCADHPTYYLASIASGLTTLVLSLFTIAILPIAGMLEAGTKLVHIKMEYVYVSVVYVFGIAVMLIAHTMVEEARSVRKIIRRRAWRKRRSRRAS